MNAETVLLGTILAVLVGAIWRAEMRHADALDVAQFIAEETGEWYESWRDAQEGQSE